MFDNELLIGDTIYVVAAQKAIEANITNIDDKYIHFKLKDRKTGYGSINNLDISIFTSKKQAAVKGY
jgi:hypothetical protein